MDSFASTTVLLVRRNGQVCMASDGQVTLNNSTVMKSGAHKVRRAGKGQVLVGFAGGGADALALFTRLEAKLEEFGGNLERSVVELAKEWRTDRALRHLDALLVVADTKSTFLLSGHGDIIEPDDGICAIGSGGTFALSAARALSKNTKMTAREIVQEAMHIAAEICIYTNTNFTIEEM